MRRNVSVCFRNINVVLLRCLQNGESLSGQVCKAAPVPGETKVWQYIALTRTGSDTGGPT